MTKKSGSMYLTQTRRILTKLAQPAFMKAFSAKARMGHLLASIPVKVILNDQTALNGAARCAEIGASLL